MALWIPSKTDQLALVSIACDAAVRHGITRGVVCAVCEEESGNRDNVLPNVFESWNQWAVRFESGFEERYIKPKVPNIPTTEELTLAISFGLMQIMGQTAREFGYTDRYLTGLCDPATGVEYGCRKLRHCLDRARGDVRSALLFYNGGGDTNYPLRVMPRISKYAA